MRSHPPVWAQAIARLMTTQGFRSQSAVLATAKALGIHLRSNTLSDAMSTTRTNNPRIDTLVKIAAALEVPFWALFCTDDEYRLFTAAQRPERSARMDASFRELMESLKQTAEGLVQANVGIKRSADAALAANGEHEDLRESVARLEHLVMDQSRDLREMRTELQHLRERLNGGAS